MAIKRGMSVVALLGSAALLAACSGTADAGDGSSDSGSASGSAGGDQVTLTWWHNSNTDPGMQYYQDVADAFTADHPNVTIEVEAMQHEDMVTQLEAAFQSGNAPDVYMERGGGELRDHVEAGLTMDISDTAADTITTLGGSVAGWQVDGKTYALPFSVGVVGFWYNTKIWSDNGLEPPATWDEFYTDIDTLKANGIAPLSVGAADGWPAAHYYYYFALRECSQQTLTDGLASYDFSDDCFLRAADDLKAFVDSEPFNDGYLATVAQAGATSASGLLVNGQVSAEMQGHWEPGVMQGLNDGTPMENLGWFPFPAIDGGEGDPGAAIGGGDAWACSADAPPECVDFITYLLSDDVQTGFAELDMGLPTNPAATGAVSDPTLASLLAFRDAAPYVQLYFDTALGTNVGNAMNAAIVNVFAGQAAPDTIITESEKAAELE
ncbi:extracellular solute-binding protein [Actinotalea sp. M2MS4P-6]|uniref:ABC transporter substrate-binding protein n=1 Tax=Actinotalea sp. M2MS4P-6 TaxID=2983762 RepID=UPI0021E3627A|nr:extracellular solute-binding protein [Actinotalea sp. M2MS4P-6]MCV2395011.1 extracellular solute-binding protein [Actinotalea sp. M2MS4P-6]